jgi:RHS repeat-associated protein
MQGKERDLTFGLNWVNFGARRVNPTIGRMDNVDGMASKFSSFSTYNYTLNNPIRFIDPDGNMTVPFDDYYENQTGKYLGSDGASTTNSRLISSSSFNQISLSNGGSTSAEATTALQAGSQMINIDDAQIQTSLQGVRDNSRSSGVEHSIYIALNPETATISAVEGPTGTNGKTNMIYERPEGTTTSFMASGETNQVSGLSILIGQAHGHPQTQEAGMVNVRGTSALDKDASRNSGVPVYSVDSYSGKKFGGIGVINRVSPNGEQSNRVGTTIGTGITGNFNIGLDALQRSGGKIK